VDYRSHGLDPPSDRDPRRRCGGLLASDGGGRGRHARASEDASPAAYRSEDQGAPGPHRQDHRRRHAGGISQRRRRDALRGRGAARDDRPRARRRPTSGKSGFASASISATSSPRAATSSATASMLRRASKRSRSPVGSAFPGRCATTSATSCPIRWKIGASRVSRTSHVRCGSMRCAPKRSLTYRRRIRRSRCRVGDAPPPLLQWWLPLWPCSSSP
jgi:hypothetical protein